MCVVAYVHTNAIPSDNYLLGTNFQRPYGPFGTKPAWASGFIGVSILLDTEALAGFAMPARASSFDMFYCSILPKHC